MESATFRRWLAERGCHFAEHEHRRHHEGPVMVTVSREGHKTDVPLGGSRQHLDPQVVQRACEELGLDPSQLPGPKSRFERHATTSDGAGSRADPRVPVAGIDLGGSAAAGNLAVHVGYGPSPPFDPARSVKSQGRRRHS